ncbi:unnamed protein product, partial [Pocillopora meandrina]
GLESSRLSVGEIFTRRIFLQPQVRAYEFLKNNVKITVFDIPGLADTKGSDEECIRKITEKKFCSVLR